MKVGNKINPGVQNLNTNSTDKVSLKSKQNPSAAAKNLGNLGESSKVDVSSRAQMMSKAREIASQETVDEAKVARLQKLIDSGQYNVSATDIADRLVDQHLLTSE